MNTFDLSTSDLLIWGIVLHLIADWPLQNDWMANNKARRAHPYSLWFIRHPAAYVHASIHGVLLAIVFGWPAVFLVYAHLIIDTRVPVVWWSRLIRQTQPQSNFVHVYRKDAGKDVASLYDIATEVRFWTDQTFHIACIAIAALVVGT